MKYKEVKQEIHRIAKLKNSMKVLEEVKKLDIELQKPKIETRKRGNYYYFYEMEHYWDKEVKAKRTRVIENVGRIKIEDYESDPDKFLEMSKEELKNYLDQY